MDLAGVREYFQSFRYELLTSSKNHKEEIKNFSSSIGQNTLQQYLQEDAWEDDLNGFTRVYLVKDGFGKIALFFSLRCSAVFTRNEFDQQYHILSPDQKEFVDGYSNVLKLGDTDRLLEYQEQLKSVFPDNYSTLLMIGERQYSRTKALGESLISSDLFVENCCPAIELQHFCKCENYTTPATIRFPLGFGLFWEKIVPLIVDISKQIGCEYLFLFAADHSENKDKKRLYSYYKDRLFFEDATDEGVEFLVTKHEEECPGLTQRIQSIIARREYAWQAYSDLLDAESKQYSFCFSD